MMRRRIAAVLALMGGLAPLGAWAQTHAVKKPETVVRAVAVYEWVGPDAKPTGSRIVPVSLYINNALEDAGVYMARPVPFALDSGNVFEVQKSGLAEGTVEVNYQRHLDGTTGAPFDDGWLGYGTIKLAPKPTEYAGKQRGPLAPVEVSGNRPHFSNSGGSSTTTTSTDDANKPTMQRRTDSSTGSTASTADTNKPVPQTRPSAGDSSTAGSDSSKTSTADADDPNRPVLIRRNDTADVPDTPSASSPTQTSSGTASSRSSTTASSGSDTADDPDRPTLKKRTPAQAKPEKRKGDTASVTSASDLNNDPDRPVLHRGSELTPEVSPLNGLPADMKQMVAVSDAKTRPEHDFTRPWDNDAERAEVLSTMQQMARDRLAKYAAAAVPASKPATAPAAAKTTSARTKKAVPPPAPAAPAEAALTDESLRGYTLSYGGAATFVYSASSPGAAGVTRYVSVVAQREPSGELKAALSSVTDSKHLDRTPWLRLVDAVDAEASNRASLLFEMRAQNARQFALYRVIGAQAEQVFETGTTQ